MAAITTPSLSTCTRNIEYTIHCYVPLPLQAGHHNPQVETIGIAAQQTTKTPQSHSTIAQYQDCIAQ